MPFEFPVAPVAGDTHTEFGVDYIWTGNTWDLAGGGAMTDYVLKAGDTMTVGPLETFQPAHFRANATDPIHGAVRLSGGAAGRTGIVEFIKDKAAAGDPDLRLARFGWGTATEIEFAFENGCTGLRMIGGGLRWGSDTAQTDPLNLSREVCLYGYGGTSQFGFSITSGTLNYVVQNAGNKHAFMVGTELVMDVRSDGLRIPGGNLSVTGTINATGEIRGQGNIFAERDLHATGNFDVDGSTDIVGTSELRGPVNTRASFNAYGGVRLMDNQQLHFDSGKNEGEGQSVAMLFRKKGGSELWGEIAYQAVDYGSSSVDEAMIRVQMAQGGYGWSNALEIKTGSVYCPRDCSASSFSDRGTADTKSDIRECIDAEVRDAFAALKPKRFRKNEIAPVDYDGNPLPALPQPKLRFGFVADDIFANAATKDIAVLDTHGEIDGTDVMQVVALCVAKIKQLEAEIATLKAQPRAPDPPRPQPPQRGGRRS